jgi:hypothetical protein
LTISPQRLILWAAVVSLLGAAVLPWLPVLTVVCWLQAVGASAWAWVLKENNGRS